MLTPYGEHPDQVIDFLGVDGPLVTLIHGGYWKPVHTREHMQPLAAALVQKGFRVANIEYRREPGNPKATLDDVNSALKQLEESIAIIGFSVGGQLALIAESRVHKLILLAPVTDLERTKRERLGEDAVINAFGDIELAEFDPMQRSYDAHLYIIHGDADDRVPLSHSRDFAKSKGASLMEVSGGDHFAMINPESLAFEFILQSLVTK